MVIYHIYIIVRLGGLSNLFEFDAIPKFKKYTDIDRLGSLYECNYVSRQNAMIHFNMLPQRAGSEADPF